MTDHTYGGSTQQANMVGGDQFAMAMSSWNLYYAYTGDTTLVKDMAYIANTYLANSMSDSTDVWGNLPYPCNASNPSLPVYDGDFVLGAGYTQPDKAGSFAFELLTLFKITGDSNYLNTAVTIANTLAANVAHGDSATSPYPFKVNAQTGVVPPGIPALTTPLILFLSSGFLNNCRLWGLVIPHSTIRHITPLKPGCKPGRNTIITGVAFSKILLGPLILKPMRLIWPVTF